MQDEQERNVALSAMAQEIRTRMKTPRSEFINQNDAFAAARDTIGAWRVIYRIRFRPLVARDIDGIAHWIIDYGAPRKIASDLTAV